MKEARQRFETRLVEVDSGRKQEYEFKLTESLAQMRAQNEEQIKLYKDNMDGTYQTRVGALSLLLSLIPVSVGLLHELNLTLMKLWSQNKDLLKQKLDKRCGLWSNFGQRTKQSRKFHIAASWASGCSGSESETELFLFVWLPLKASSPLQLEELHRTSEMNEASGNMAREELRESSLRIESLSAQLAGLQKEVGAPSLVRY